MLTRSTNSGRRAVIQQILALAGMAAAVNVWSQDGSQPSAMSPALVWSLALLALAVLAVIVFVLRSTSTKRVPEGGGHSQFDPLTPKSYSPKNVGNDASARPWEQMPASSAGEQSSGLASAVAQANRFGSASQSLPEGFDRHAFLIACQDSFRYLQSAWDDGQVEEVKSRLSESMLEQLEQQLAHRAQEGEKSSKTEVFNLQAQLIQVRDRGEFWCATVEFSGMSRDEAAAGPGPFRELWELHQKKTEAAPWLVADVQAIR